MTWIPSVQAPHPETGGIESLSDTSALLWRHFRFLLRLITEMNLSLQTRISLCQVLCRVCGCAHPEQVQQERQPEPGTKQAYSLSNTSAVLYQLNAVNPKVVNVEDFRVRMEAYQYAQRLLAFLLSIFFLRLADVY